MQPKERFNQLLDKYKDDPEFVFEGLVLGVSEKIASMLAERHMTRLDLAKVLSCSPAYVTKLLRGSENLTLRKLFEVSRASGGSLSVDIIPQTKGERPEKGRQEKRRREIYTYHRQKKSVVSEKKSSSKK